MIVVLTLGRSGSSVLMQTLERLGADVVGRKFDEKEDSLAQRRHEELNPGGYYELPDLYYGGPAAIAFQELLRTADSSIACKMDIRHLIDPAQNEAWQNCVEKITSLVVSFRSPSEQAHSEYIAGLAPGEANTPGDKFLNVTRFLRDYVQTYGHIHQIIKTQLPALAPKVKYLDYAKVLDPSIYVREVADIVKLIPTNDQFEAAVSNIKPELFRIKRVDLNKDELQWAVQSGAETAYNHLKKLQNG